MWDMEDVNHCVPIEQSSGSGHCITAKGNPQLCVCLCGKAMYLWVSPTIPLCAWLVRRTNFPVRLFTGFLQLRQGSARGLQSDPAGRRPLLHRGATYLVCVCLSVWLWCLRVCWTTSLLIMIYRIQYSLELVIQVWDVASTSSEDPRGKNFSFYMLCTYWTSCKLLESKNISLNQKYTINTFEARVVKNRLGDIFLPRWLRGV